MFNRTMRADAETRRRECYLGVADLLLVPANSFPSVLMAGSPQDLDGIIDRALLDSVFSRSPRSDKSTFSVMSVVGRGL